MIQITDEIYISIYQIHYIKKCDDCFEIYSTLGMFTVTEYSRYYDNIVKLLKE